VVWTSKNSFWKMNVMVYKKPNPCTRISVRVQKILLFLPQNDPISRYHNFAYIWVTAMLGVWKGIYFSQRIRNCAFWFNWFKIGLDMVKNKIWFLRFFGFLAPWLRTWRKGLVFLNHNIFFTKTSSHTLKSSICKLKIILQWFLDVLWTEQNIVFWHFFPLFIPISTTFKIILVFSKPILNQLNQN